MKEYIRDTIWAAKISWPVYCFLLAIALFSNHIIGSLIAMTYCVPLWVLAAGFYIWAHKREAKNKV